MSIRELAEKNDIPRRFLGPEFLLDMKQQGSVKVFRGELAAFSSQKIPTRSPWERSYGTLTAFWLRSVVFPPATMNPVRKRAPVGFAELCSTFEITW